MATTTLAHWNELSTAIILINAETNQIETLNMACEQLLKHSAKTLRQHPWWHWFDQQPHLQQLSQQLLEQKTDHFRVIAQLNLSSDNNISVIITGKFLSDNSPKLLLELVELSHSLNAARNQQVMIEQQRQQAFLKNLAHEIKNPLGGIRGAAQLLALENLPTDLHECTSIIIKETDRLHDLLKRLLSPQEKQLKSEAFNIHEACEHVLHLLSIQYPTLNLVRDYDISLPDINADRQKIIQILLNLGLNAAQSLINTNNPNKKIITRTRIERQVTLQQKLYPLIIAITIQDNGPGIATDIQPYLFHPLISNKTEGTGLGLSIAQTLAQQHHGSLHHHTNAGNTCFTLSLPLPN